MPGDRTERATPRQRQKAAEKGDRAHSRDLMAAASMLAAVYVLGDAAPKWVAGWNGVYQVLLGLGQPALWDRTSAAETAVAIRGIFLKALAPLGLVFLVSLAAAVAAGIAQGGGWALNFEALAFKPERLSPVDGVQAVAQGRINHVAWSEHAVSVVLQPVCCETLLFAVRPKIVPRLGLELAFD